MKALMKMSHQVGDVSLEEIPEAVCTPDGVKVEVKYCGICGTDIHIYHDRFRYYPPVIMGHEGCGEVVEVGENIKTIKPGDRVSLLGSTMEMCGECEYCRQGKYMFCATRRGMGHGVNGMFTKYVVVREDMCYKIPGTMSFEEGALAEAFGTAVQAVEEVTDIHVGDVALVTGPGPIGLMCAALLSVHGCYVIVAGTDADAKRLEIAKALGAEQTINISRQNMKTVIDDITSGRGADIAYEASGNRHAINGCFDSLKKLGKFVQVGINGNPTVDVNFDAILYKQLQVYGALGHSLETWDRLMRIFYQGKIDLKPLITHKMPLSQWKKAFDMCEKQEAVKVLLYHD